MTEDYDLHADPYRRLYPVLEYACGTWTVRTHHPHDPLAVITGRGPTLRAALQDAAHQARHAHDAHRRR